MNNLPTQCFEPFDTPSAKSLTNTEITSVKNEEPVKTKSPNLKVSEDNLIEIDIETDTRPKTLQNASASISNDYDRPDLDDRFELLEPIGEGAMAYVWKVRDKSIDQILALKLLRKELTQDPEAVSRFQQEARLTMQLEHPHIAAVYEPGNDKNGRPYILMDFVPGETLQQLLAREGKLAEERALGIFEQICQALSYAHMHGIVHRDIKPSNIMIDSTESGADFVKVVDFGIARSIHEEVHNTQALTRPLGDFATPRYMSPEQCLGQEITPQSDIYSLGCVLYEMISGAPPFTETNQVRLILQHLNDNPDLTKFSPKVASILFFSLAKDKEARIDNLQYFCGPITALDVNYRDEFKRVRTLNWIGALFLIVAFGFTAPSATKQSCWNSLLMVLLSALLNLSIMQYQIRQIHSSIASRLLSTSNCQIIGITVFIFFTFAKSIIQNHEFLLEMLFAATLLTLYQEKIANKIINTLLQKGKGQLKSAFIEPRIHTSKRLMFTCSLVTIILWALTTNSAMYFLNTIPIGILAFTAITVAFILIAVVDFPILIKSLTSKERASRLIKNALAIFTAILIGITPGILITMAPHKFWDFRKRLDTSEKFIFYLQLEQIQKLLKPELTSDYSKISNEQKQFHILLAQYTVLRSEVYKRKFGSKASNLAFDAIIEDLRKHYPQGSHHFDIVHIRGSERNSHPHDQINAAWMLYDLMRWSCKSDPERFSSAYKLSADHPIKDPELAKDIDSLIQEHYSKPSQ